MGLEAVLFLRMLLHFDFVHIGIFCYKAQVPHQVNESCTLRAEPLKIAICARLSYEIHRINMHRNKYGSRINFHTRRAVCEEPRTIKICFLRIYDIEDIERE